MNLNFYWPLILNIYKNSINTQKNVKFAWKGSRILLFSIFYEWKTSKISKGSLFFRYLNQYGTNFYCVHEIPVKWLNYNARHKLSCCSGCFWMDNSKNYEEENFQLKNFFWTDLFWSFSVIFQQLLDITCLPLRDIKLILFLLGPLLFIYSELLICPH